ncbi:MAG: ATP-grasp domain-containing protein [Candidatus Omnitrophota bacterium]|nr:ATP-grasp domain-containing protein [Candidatus Omnitrophota bacterium]
MRKIVEYLRDRYGPWGWMGQRAHDAVGINHVLPLDFIISCDHGQEIPYYFREEDVFSVEKRQKVRRDWSNEDLKASLRGVLGREIYQRWNSYSKKVNLLCYRSVKRLERSGKQLLREPRIYAVPENLKRHFDNKILLHRSLAKLSLPKIPGKIEMPGRCTFNSLRKEISLPFVIQLPFGSSGLFTFIIREEKEYNRVRRFYPDSPAVIRKYIDGFSLNVNAVIVSREKGPEIFCSIPSVQITGLPECSNFSSAFCGNDYALSGDLGSEILDQVENHMRVIGTWMAGTGFRGIFGMDFVVDRRTVYPVEINPRFQNSTALYTVLNALSPRPGGSLFLLHVAEFLQGRDKVMKKYVRTFPGRELMRPVEGSQVIIHNRMSRNIVTGRLLPGIYRLEGRNLVFVRAGASLKDCRGRDDILITCGVPGPGTPVEPNAPICKVQIRTNALNPVNKRTLTSRNRKIVLNVYEKLSLKEAKKTELVGAG